MEGTPINMPQTMSNDFAQSIIDEHTNCNSTNYQIAGTHFRTNPSFGSKPTRSSFSRQGGFLDALSSGASSSFTDKKKIGYPHIIRTGNMNKSPRISRPSYK